MSIEITGDTLQMAQEMTQTERDALLIEIYRAITHDSTKITRILNTTDKVDTFVEGIVSNPPGGLLGKMMPDMSQLLLPAPPVVGNRAARRAGM